MNKRWYILDDSAQALRAFWGLIQGTLFPVLEEGLSPFDDAHRKSARLCAAVRDDFRGEKYAWCGNGRPPACWRFYFKAYIAKSVWNFRTTGTLISELKPPPRPAEALRLRARGGHPIRGELLACV